MMVVVDEVGDYKSHILSLVDPDLMLFFFLYYGSHIMGFSPAMDVTISPTIVFQDGNWKTA